MQAYIIDWIDQFGYLGIFLLIFVENIFPPIPSEVVLLFGGAATAHTDLSVPLVILVATLGSLAGAAVLYGLGHVLQAERLRHLFAGRFGRVLHLKPEAVDQAEHWFARYEGRAVLICRCIPVVRSLISIPAGFAKMRLPWFFFLTLMGSLVWNTVLVVIGASLGNAWESVIPYFEQYTMVVLVVILFLAIAGVGWLIYKGRKNKGSKDKGDFT
ncbi:MAG: DedA family protein [Christensenella sp.]|uniref:DedA family protein n=1 Tax=Christensenella sp. TaxID=1935934 RepID=UPI002B1F39C2|nr:DedA family protein [Christensenella sp.]MEA5003378.1 DedA family protein [Christensenella sp.]